jgi:spore germination cell wall hydrolase CwlJ-like protein
MKTLLTISLCLCALVVNSAQLPTSSLAVRAIIGEAAGEPFQTKLAIAGALRNRGTLEGVVGLRNARMINRQPAWVWRDARVAWAESATNDITHGAAFFESTNFPTPSWAVDMHITASVGKFRFYKP